MRKKTLANEGLFAARQNSALAAAEHLLRTPPPDVSGAEAEDFALRHYGRKASARLLTGERDRNFLISDANGWSAVLKFYNSADDAPTRALQHGALAHVHARDPVCPVPQICPSLDGKEEVVTARGGIEMAAVMVSRLPGVNPVAEDLSPALRADVGRVVGSLSRALADYAHPRAARAILWDMMLVAELRPLAALIDTPDQRASVEVWLDHFTASVLPAMRDLPHQPIHNDLSLSNLMVDPARRDRVTGVIDFGDIVHAPRINEFAVAASYFIAPTGDLAQSIAEILQGIGPDLALLPQEVTLIPDLIKARLATRILLSGWRAQLFPDNRTYILRSNLAAWTMWQMLEAEGTEALSRRLLSLAEGVLA